MDQERKSRHFNVKIFDEEVILSPLRALIFPTLKIAAVADLHWGKTEVFQQFGIRLPQGILKDDLSRLTQVIEESGCRHLLILGDLVHHRRGIDDVCFSEIMMWRKKHAVRITLVEGNHDRDIELLLRDWDIEIEFKSFRLNQFLFSHEKISENELPEKVFNFFGHVHPVFRVNMYADSLRLPCFFIGENFGVLPAFSTFSGGYEMPLTAAKQIYVIAQEKIIQVI